jgi:hypothetical protein
MTGRRAAARPGFRSGGQRMVAVAAPVPQWRGPMGHAGARPHHRMRKPPCVCMAVYGVGKRRGMRAGPIPQLKAAELKRAHRTKQHQQR